MPPPGGLSKIIACRIAGKKVCVIGELFPLGVRVGDSRKDPQRGRLRPRESLDLADRAVADGSAPQSAALKRLRLSPASVYNTVAIPHVRGRAGWRRAE